MADLPPPQGEKVASPPSELDAASASDDARTRVDSNTSADSSTPLLEFAEGDKENPYEWSRTKKYITCAVACFITYSTGFNSTGNSAVKKPLEKAFHVSASVATTTTSTFTLMLGIAPLVLAPVSEDFGRRPLLLVLTPLIVLLFLPQALAPNITSVALGRLFQGMGASIEGPIVAGVLADVYKASDRGAAFGFYSFVVFFGHGAGPLSCNWIAENMGWRDVYWIQMGTNGLTFILVALLLRETRGDVLLRQRAKRLQKQNGEGEGKVAVLDQGKTKEDWKTQLKHSLSRPIMYLLTEPIVTAMSLWIGFAWGLVYLFTAAIPHIYEEVYDFSPGQSGNVFISEAVGGALGFLLNFYQDHLYHRAARRNGGRAPPESRLYASAFSGIMLGIGMFGFGWTARKGIHWMASVVFIGVINFAIYGIYVAVYAYLSDSYEKYSSSAQASQAVLRYLFGSTFPFYGEAMYNNLTFKWASSLLGFLSFALAVIPFVLIRYGKAIRERSRVASEIIRDQQERVAREKGHLGGREDDLERL